MSESMSTRVTARGRNERGAALAVVVLLVLFATLGALVALAYADSFHQRMAGEVKIERAGLIAESGLSFYVEQWRRSSTFLDSSNGVYPTTTAVSNANLQKAVTCSAGTFTLLEIDRVTLGAGGATEGRVVTVRGDYDGVRYTVRALLAPNLNSPIQGVGTSSTQTWLSGARFGATGNDLGTVFGNAGATFNSGVIITGNAAFVGSLTNNGTVTGTVKTGVPSVTFPDQVAIVNAAISNAASNRNTSGFWRDASADILAAAVASGGVKPTSMERSTATVTNLNSGSGDTTWSGSNTMSMYHWAIQGGELSLPAGNYAFGRLYLDGTILTLKAPSGGGVLVMPDIYLANGARLILDTTDGPFDIVTGKNNAFESAFSLSSGRRYDAATNTLATTTTARIRMPGDTGTWIGESGGSDPVKKSKGNGHLDDWQIKDGSLLAIVTSHPTDVGAELFMKTDVDLTLANGSALISGIQAADLAAVKNRSTSMSSITALAHNATGFNAWSAGGGNPRLDINTDAGAGGNPSLYVGLTYGAWPGRIGSNGTLEGAFVGSTLRNAGTILYDSRLAALVSSGDANSQHVVVRARVN